MVLAGVQGVGGLEAIDLGAGHASASDSLCGRVITALKSQALLNESVGAGYLDRNWPPALKASGAWPLASLRQSFLNGSLTRLVDPDAVLPGRLLHDFRRTAVRNLERSGVSRSAAMAMVGHETESIYRRYAIVDETALREAGQKLAALES